MGARHGLAASIFAVTAGLVAVAFTVASQNACNAFSLPTRECLAEGMTADTASGDDACQSCLQTRCCDRVGECAQVEGCREAVATTHACVLDGGRPQVDEPLCTPLLRAVPARESAVATYTCLRESCRAECGLGSCRFGAEIPTFQNAACDRCVESTCCAPVEACAGDRRCKAALACVVASCPAELSAIVGGDGQAAAAALEREACEDVRGVDAGGPLPCMTRCLDLFAPRLDDVVTDDREARCAATRVLACGARSGCGAQCSTFFTSPPALSPDGG